MYKVTYWTGRTFAEKDFYYAEAARAFCRLMQRGCKVFDNEGKVIATFRSGREVMNNG